MPIEKREDDSRYGFPCFIYGCCLMIFEIKFINKVIYVLATNTKMPFSLE